MPQTISKIKGEMVFNQDLTHVIDAMKGIAASQYFVMEHKKTSTEKYDEVMAELFKLYDFRRSRSPFIRQRSKKKLIVLVTTDGGFLGGLNMKVVTAGMKYRTGDAQYMVIGQRGVNYLKEFGLECKAYPGIEIDNSRFDLVETVLKDIMAAVKSGAVGQVVLVHPYSISFLAQRVDALNIVPCPMFFKGKPAGVPIEEQQRKEILLESSAEGIIESLSKIWLRKRLVEIFETSKMAEFGARTMHLESSYSTLNKLLKQLKLDYFKARRAKIDQSIRESFISQIVCRD